MRRRRRSDATGTGRNSIAAALPSMRPLITRIHVISMAKNFCMNLLTFLQPGLGSRWPQPWEDLLEGESRGEELLVRHHVAHELQPHRKDLTRSPAGDRNCRRTHQV